MQRFVQGSGSFANISLTIEAKPKINYTKSYAAFVTYDEGSNIGGSSIVPRQFYHYIIYFIIYIAASVVTIFYLRRLIYRRRYRRIFNEIFLKKPLLRKTPADIDRDISLIQYYYTDGKLHKADHDIMVRGLQQIKENYISTNKKITRYTSKGTPITDEK